MKDIVLIGGNSQLGRAIRRIPAFSGFYFVREKQHSKNALFCQSYDKITASDLEPFRYIVNLAGTDSTDSTILKRVNVDLAENLAREASRSGAKCFVHISSFSVFGNTELIEADSVTSPTTAYGTSKAEAELAVGQIGNSDFKTISVRLPMLYGPNGSKLHALLNLWSKIRHFPVPYPGIRRSMIHYDLAARGLLSALSRDSAPVIALADPKPFRFDDTAEIMSACAGHRVSPLVVGSGLLKPVKWLRPRLHQSLYSSSYLTDEANALKGLGIESRLYRDIYEMASSIYA